MGLLVHRSITNCLCDLLHQDPIEGTFLIAKTKVSVLLGLLLLYPVTEQQKLLNQLLPAVLALLDDLLEAQREGLVILGVFVQLDLNVRLDGVALRLDRSPRLRPGSCSVISCSVITAVIAFQRLTLDP